MKCVIFEPGRQFGMIRDLDEPTISAAVGGFADQYTWSYRGQEIVIYHNSKRAEACGAEPNRLLDDAVVYGRMIVTGLKKPLSNGVASDLAYDCDWPMVQVERRNAV